MRSLFVTLRAAAAAVLVLAAACRPPPAATEPAIWRIADADSEIWLYGTVHVLPPELRWRGPRVNAAFAAAEELVTETDMGPAAEAEIAALAARYGTLPAGERLSELLAPGDRRRLAAAAREFRLDLAALERMRPWLAALQLTYVHAAREGHRPELGVEEVLAAEARQRGLRLSYLETGEQQVRTLADLSQAEQIRFLAATLRQIESDGAALAAMNRLWASGDVETLGRALDAQWEEAGPALHQALIVERNRAWAEEIARRLDGEGRIFVAVGAAHLAGEHSVVELLRARGMEVEGP